MVKVRIILSQFPVSLTYDDVLNYLDSLLTDIDEQTDNIIALVCEKEDSTKFDMLLKELANKDKSNIAVEKQGEFKND